VVVSTEEEELDQATTSCEQLEQELTKAQELLQQIRHRRKEILVELRQLAKDLKAGQASVPKLELEIGNCDTTRENLTNLIPQLEKQIQETKADEAKLSQLEQEVKDCENELDACTEKASELEKEKDRLQKAILEAGGKDWKQQEAKCKKLQLDLDKTEKEIRSAKVAVTTNEKNMTKAENTKLKSEEQLAASNEALQKYRADLKALEDDALVVMQAYEKVKALEAQKKEELEATDSEFEGLKKEQSSAKCAEVDLIGQIDSIDKQLQDIQAKSRHLQSEMFKIEEAAKQDEEEWGDLSEDGDEDSDGDEESSRLVKMDEDVDIDELKSLEEQDLVAKEETVAKTKSKEFSALPIFNPETLKRHDRDTVKERIAILETERNSIAKNANLGAIAEYRKKEAEYLAR